MLVIKPRTHGAGIIDIISKVANSALAKKVINSTVGKKVIQKATKDNLIKAANSAIGKQLQTAVVKGVANASEKAANSTFEKLLPEKAALEKIFAATIPLPAPKGPKRKLSSKPGRSKKRKRAKAFGA